MIEIDLTKEGSRLVNLEITDKHGEVYAVNLEFIAHDFNEDDVQVSVYKLPKNHKVTMATPHKDVSIIDFPRGSTFRLSKEGGFCELYPPNSIIHNEKVIDRKAPNHTVTSSVWYEFHATGSLPSVRS
jgi:hypothetical protein